ncbi:MAG: PAS domain S-box protein [Candidatus Omnitrophica bacterium]|nr:PAS domain S-box protein [Candidatus Omnitrophota bacterium]
MQQEIKHKTGIRRKITLMICLCLVIFASVVLSLGYFWAANLLRNNIGEDYRDMAQLLSAAMARIIDEEILDIDIYMSHPLRIDEIKRHNLNYEGMDQDAIRAYFKSRDEEWISDSEDNLLVKRYLESPVSKRLTRVKDVDNSLSEIFVTDRFGGLVAASGKTTDFYQADEQWWQEAFNNGEGKVYIEGANYDESSNVLGISLAVPIRGSGEVIGVCKAVLDIKRFFSALENFKIGKTGHAVLIDQEANILYHPEFKPLTAKFFSTKDLGKLLENKNQWMMIDKSKIQGKRMFVAYALVMQSNLLERGLSWRICIDQESAEVFESLNRLIFNSLIIIIILLIVLAGLGFIFSGIFVKPITILHEATTKVAEGNLNFKVEINTGDEIEQFSDSFNVMIDKLKNTTTFISDLNKEIDMRKKAEGELVKINELNQALLATIPFGIDIVAEDGTIIFANNILKHACGDDLEGRKCWEAYKDNKKQCDLCPLKKDVWVEGIETCESRDVLGGRVVQITYAGMVYKGKKAILEIFEDITERKKVEEAVRMSEEKYRILFDSSRDAIMTLDCEGKFLSCNKATLELFACESEEGFISKGPAEVSPEQQPDGLSSFVKSKQMMEMAIDKGSHFFEWKHKTMKGEEFFATVLLTAMEISGKKLLQATVRNITEHKIAQQELEKLSRAVEQSPSVVVITDVKGNLVYVNPKFTQLTGYSSEEVLGKNPRVLKSGDMPSDSYSDLWKTIIAGKEWRGEFHNKKKNGQLYWEQASISPIREYSGEVNYYLKVAEDITQRKKNQEAIRMLYEEMEQKNIELQRLDDLKSNFVATVSHELRTPLSITKEGISLILDKIPGEINEKQERILVTSKNNIDRLARIINELLDISKIESGKVILKRQLININRLIKDVVSSFELKAKEKGLEIKTKLPTKKLEVYLDSDKAVQIFVNLINNAFKFTEKGYIEIVIEAKNDEVVCSVVDTGKGIAKSDLSKIFDKFQQFERDVGAGEKGTGLGLSIVKGIVTLHNGRIWVESSKGKGTKFIFTFPNYNSDALFKEFIKDAIRDAARDNIKMSLVILNIDNFIELNKELSLREMKIIVKEISSILESAIKGQGRLVTRDVVGEYIITLADCNRYNALRIEERLRRALDSYLIKKRLVKKVSFGVRISTYPDDAKGEADLIDKARRS